MKLYPLNSFPRYFLVLTFLIFILYHLNDGACHNMPNPPPLLAWRHLWFSFKGFIKSAPCSPLSDLWVWTRPGGDSPHWHPGWCPTSPPKFVRLSDQKKSCSASVRRSGTKVDLNPPGKKTRQVGEIITFLLAHLCYYWINTCYGRWSSSVKGDLILFSYSWNRTTGMPKSVPRGWIG